MADASFPVLVSTGGALLGVVVGGVLNWRMQRVMERSRLLKLARAGVRIVALDLHRADSALEAAEQERVWRRASDLPTEAWMGYREVLAEVLEAGEWRDLAQAMVELQRLKSQFDRIGGAGPTSSELPKDTLDSVSRGRTLIGITLADLEGRA